MNSRIKKIRKTIFNREHHRYRQEIDPAVFTKFTESLAAEGLSDVQRAARRLVTVFRMEKPVVFADEKIAFMRTVQIIPEIFTPDEWKKIKETNRVHELGEVCNICPDYGFTIGTGLEARRKEVIEGLGNCVDSGKKEFLQAVLESIDAVLELTERYAKEAEAVGNREIAAILTRVPRYGARTFHEALQSFRILHYALWASHNYHNTVGRFDQYMFPFLKADLESGRLNYDEAFELLEEFFISFNKDSNLYPGIQQGDNGQSMVLGGVDEDGNDVFNLLSEMCLHASRELKLIDPKINLRVHKGTKLEIYEMATELTREGLGFPQYFNDDVVIPGLTAKGYSLKDARNYVVAACWEFIIPGLGMDVPNIAALSFPKVLDRCLHEKLSGCLSFEDFMSSMETEIKAECARLAEDTKNLWIAPSPFMSVLMDGCIEKATDISKGAKYNNYGIHGTGLSTAVDSLAAIKKVVFRDRSVSAEKLIKAVDADFKGYDELLAMLRYEAPKMGNDDDDADGIAIRLLDIFADALEGKKNDRGGCFRAGTGSAMYYLWHADEIGASPDGRRQGEPFGANYSPSLFVRCKGPISVIKSFTKPNLERIPNGGPLTMEFDGTLFTGDESTGKVALLVKSLMDMGGQQLQLNVVSRERLLEAQKHPESYRNVIVRVWGWSAYFVELDRKYQDHVIKRQEYSI